MSVDSPEPKLQRVIGLPSAVMLGLGSIIGTGLFVSLGIGIDIAGPMVMPAIALAGLVAMCNGLSSAQLAANHPISGGTYEYGHRWLNPTLGFTSGWMFLCAKSASAATAALGFAWYIHPEFALPVAVTLVVAITLLTITGLQRSNAFNIAIVSLVLMTVTTFVIKSAPALLEHPDRLKPLFDPKRFPDLLQAAALMFVAYTGYGRVATLGEEVQEPRRTIPRAVIITLIISLMLYLTVAAVGLAQSEQLGKLANGFGGSLLGKIVTGGAAIAMVSVLLNLVLGLSRVVLAMGRRGDLPKATASITESTKVPALATIIVSLLITGLVCLGDMKLTWSFSAFTVLVYYALTNLCAIRLKDEERLYPVWIAYIGFIACLSLAFFVEWRVMITGLGLIALGLIWKKIFRQAASA
tara:strand:+ start:461 stop:1693 length:1233 start_codon:yes stop_codon:yes gene_type:complete